MFRSPAKSRALVTVVFVAAVTSIDARQAAAPLAPTMLPATVVGGNVSLFWVANPAGAAATAYRLEAGTAPGLSDVAILTVGPLPTSMNAVAPAGTYYVRVIALNESVASAASNEIVVVVGGPGACLLPGVPTGLAATLTPGGVSLRWDAPSIGGAPSGYTLLVGSAPGALNIGVFSVGLMTAISSPAPGGVYFVRVVASNGCGSSAPSAEISFTIGASSGPLSVPAGLYLGTVLNFTRTGIAPIRSFTLQLNQPVPSTSFFQVISARWQDNRGCLKTTGILGNTTSAGPGIALESFACNDGDFGLRVTNVSGNVYSGVCVGGGPSCTFQMIRQ